MRTRSSLEKSGLIFSGIGIFFCASYFIYFLSVKNKPDKSADLATADSFSHKNIEPNFSGNSKISIVTPLLKESLEESLERLDDIESYIGRGTAVEGSASIATFPMEERVGRFDIQRILGNRRFLKAYWEVAHLSKSDASALLDQQLRATLPLYLKAHQKNVNFIKSTHPDPKKGPTAFGVYQITSNPHGTPTLLGLRYKLLSLLLIAGNLKLSELKPIVIDIAKTAINQYQEASDLSVFNISIGFDIAKSSSLYNRQILLSSYIGVLNDDIKFKPFFNALKNQPITVKIAKYGSSATQSDTYAIVGLPPASQPGKSIVLQYYEYASDLDFKEFIE